MDESTFSVKWVEPRHTDIACIYSLNGNIQFYVCVCVFVQKPQKTSKSKCINAQMACDGWDLANKIHGYTINDLSIM